jgi:hypothetical protein
MGQVTRRGLLLGLGTGAALSVFGSQASATLARSVTLPSLVQSSRSIVVVTALAAESRYEQLGRRRRIVTDTRVRVEERLAKETVETELMVRTLGGSVGRVGELVHGQATLSLGKQCVAFLLRGPDGLHYVNGMAQGHYPLSEGGVKRLLKSPDLGELLNAPDSAVKQLVGAELVAARLRIRALSQK